MAKETAEQKLLKLIEATDAKQPAANAGTAASTGQAAPEAQKVFESVSGVSLPSVSLPSFLTSFVSFFKNLFSSGKPATFGLKEFNKIFIVLIVVVGIIFFKEFTAGMKASNKQMHVAIAENMAKVTNIVLPATKDLTAYLSVMERRNIFQPYQPPKVEVPEVKAPEAVAAKAKIGDEVKDLKLVGISWSSTPESASAMIEDSATTVTHFLKQGDKIKEVTVKTIFADRIILEHDGETIDLKLY